MFENKKKLIYILAGILVISLISSWYFMLRKGVVIDNDYCYKKNTFYQGTHGQVVEVGENGHYILTWRGLSVEADVKSIREDSTGASRYQVHFDDGTSVECQLKDGDVWNKDGLPLWVEGTGAFATTLPGEGSGSVAKSELAEAFVRIEAGSLESKGDLTLVLIGLVLYLFGSFGMIWPEKSAMLFRRWKFKSYELSDASLGFEILGGMACVALGVFIISGIFINMVG